MYWMALQKLFAHIRMYPMRSALRVSYPAIIAPDTIKVAEIDKFLDGIFDSIKN